MNRGQLRVRASVLGLIAVAVTAGGGAAQELATSPCPQGVSVQDPRRVAQDACTQAYDVFQLMAPQLAVSLAGGNASLGQGGTLGGLGHFSLGVRANVMSGLVPVFGRFQPSESGAQRRTLPTRSQVVGLPTADAAVGLFGGVKLGFGTVGSVDALLSASYVPTLAMSGVSVTPERNLQLGYGARIGLLKESSYVPGLAATFLKRDLPQTDISGSAEISGTTGRTTIDVSTASQTTAWRLVAGKSLLVFGIAAGVGRETNDHSAEVSATVSGAFSGSATLPAVTQSLSRTNYFLDASLNLPFLKLAAEVGKVRGGSVATFNSFEGGAADRDLTYGSVGVRLGL